MGIIKRNVSAKSGGSAVTIIAQGNRFHGETSISGKMHVDGEFAGSIDSSDDISIGKTGRVSGRIRAHAVNVSGELEGELVCESLHIERGGCVRANVYCERLSIDNEGLFVGERHLPGDDKLTWEGEASLLPAYDTPPSPSEETVEEGSLIDSLPSRITLSRD
ncbi:bactofilin family protein [Marinobacterium litorale]|uniref:bactofilin family protein n=1 Tax=Marinobacterium litorale TaxID=404770 RepID=UPI0004803829|nr:polymer-forming cytoskeletal protein [Marinobacterium litorale]